MCVYCADAGFDLLMDEGMMRDIGLDPRKHMRRIQDGVVAHCPTPVS